MFRDVNSHYYPKIFVWGSPNFDYWPKILLRRVSGESFKGSKIQTTGPNRVKYDLK